MPVPGGALPCDSARNISQGGTVQLSQTSLKGYLFLHMQDPLVKKNLEQFPLASQILHRQESPCGDLLEPIGTYLNLFEPIGTYLNLLEPIGTL